MFKLRRVLVITLASVDLCRDVAATRICLHKLQVLSESFRFLP